MLTYSVLLARHENKNIFHQQLPGSCMITSKSSPVTDLEKHTKTETWSSGRRYSVFSMTSLQTSPPLLYSEALVSGHGPSPSSLIQLPGLESAAKSFGGLPSIVRPSPLWQKRVSPVVEDPQQSQTPSQVCPIFSAVSALPLESLLCRPSTLIVHLCNTFSAPQLCVVDHMGGCCLIL